MRDENRQVDHADQALAGEHLRFEQRGASQVDHQEQRREDRGGQHRALVPDDLFAPHEVVAERQEQSAGQNQTSVQQGQPGRGVGSHRVANLWTESPAGPVSLEAFYRQLVDQG